jgi:hypothetical protein
MTATAMALALDGDGLDERSRATLRNVIAPARPLARGATYDELLASFVAYDIQGEPMILALRRLANAGALDVDVVFHLIDSVAEVATHGPRAEDPVLRRIDELTDVTRRAPDWLDSDAFLPDDGFDYQEALGAERARRCLELKKVLLRRCGEESMARLFENDRREYTRRVRTGEVRHRVEATLSRPQRFEPAIGPW